MNVRDVYSESMVIQKSVAGESENKSGKCSTGMCWMCPNQYTCSTAIPKCLTVSKETEVFYFLIEEKFGVLLGHTGFFSRNGIYIDTIN